MSPHGRTVVLLRFVLRFSFFTVTPLWLHYARTDFAKKNFPYPRRFWPERAAHRIFYSGGVKRSTGTRKVGSLRTHKLRPPDLHNHLAAYFILEPTVYKVRVKKGRIPRTHSGIRAHNLQSAHSRHPSAGGPGGSALVRSRS